MLANNDSRTLWRLTAALLTLALFAPAASALAPGDTIEQVHIDLTRPESSLDETARGTLRLWTHTKQDRHRFELTVLDTNSALPHEFRVLSHETQQMEHGGMLVPKGPSKMEFKVDSKTGEPLPLNEQDNSAYSGCTVQVLRGGVPILSCVVPVVEPPEPGDPEIPVKAPMKVRLRLRPPNIDARAPKMRGTLKLRSFKKRPKQLFKLNAGRVPFDESSFTVYIEDGLNAGTFTPAGELEQRGKSKRGLLRRNTRRGEPLPMGILYVSQLAGCIVEVRDEQQRVHLEGKIAALD